MADYVILDDMSKLGLRRLHVMRPGTEVDVEKYVRMAMDEGAEIQSVLKWLDEDLDNHHLYLTWRLTMASEPMYCWGIGGDFGLAVSKASASYLKRFGRWPNRVMTRQADGLPPGVELMGSDGEVCARLELEAVETGFQAGMVGVFYREDGDHGQAN